MYRPGASPDRRRRHENDSGAWPSQAFLKRPGYTGPCEERVQAMTLTKARKRLVFYRTARYLTSIAAVSAATQAADALGPGSGAALSSDDIQEPHRRCPPTSSCPFFSGGPGRRPVLQAIAVQESGAC